MRIAILCDGASLARWQKAAVASLCRDHELFLLVCPPAPAERRRLELIAYYGLNLLSIKNSQTKRVPFPTAEMNFADRHTFHPRYDGAWASLPRDTVEWLRERRIDAVIRFNLNLIRVHPSHPPILSYHHGDPRRFRGRPAGFYETLQGENFVGQIVQVLSNTLDAGEVLAFGETAVHHHSYRATSTDAFKLSPALLPIALRRLARNQRLPLVPAGKNYRLPANLLVAKFIANMGFSFIKRLIYGAFYEKCWRVSTLASPVRFTAAFCSQLEAERQNWVTPEPRWPYHFYADCFFSDQGLLVEALNATTGKGEIVMLGGAGVRRLSVGSGHFSYPSTVDVDGQEIIVPEIASWSRPAAYAVRDGTMEKLCKIDIEGGPRIIDPTLYHDKSRFYLFGNTADEGVSVLRLWSAEDLSAKFEEHPMSPVSVGLRGGRMAGNLISEEGRLLRLGQDHDGRYGTGVIVFEISELSATAYEEAEVFRVSFSGVFGPHTLNRRNNAWAFDWYWEKFSILAGARRILARL